MKRKTIAALLIIAMIMGLSVPAYAEDTPDSAEPPQTQEQPQEPEQEETPVVANYDELVTAIDNASNGDTVFVVDFISVPCGATLGDSDKRITIKPSKDFNQMVNEMILAEPKCSPDCENQITIRNLNFDGDSKLIRTFLTIAHHVIIDNCTFKNSADENAAMACLNILTGEVGMSNTKFENTSGVFAGAVYVCDGADVTISNCCFENTTGGWAGAIYNWGTVRVNANYFSNNKSLRTGNTLCNMRNLYLEMDMDKYSELYGFAPHGWYYDADYSEEEGFLALDKMKPYDTAENNQPCSLTFAENDPYPSNEDDDSDTPPDTEPTNPNTPPDDPEDSGEDNDTPEQQPTQPPADDDGSVDTPEQPTQPEDPEDDDNSGDDTNVPVEPSEPPQDEDSPDDKDTPPVIYRPPYRPTRPIAPDPEPEDPVEPEPTPTLVCGEAAIDVSRSVVLQGYGDGELHEDDPLTRAQLATIIFRLLDESSLEKLIVDNDPQFADVPSDSWCYEYVQTIASAGVVFGVGGGNYDPNGVVTWGQIITVLSRFVEPQEYDLQNIDYDGWALQSVQTAAALGWIEDSADFNPDAVISRGALVQLVNGILEQYKS